MTLFSKLHRHLDPVVSLGEIIFGLIMALTFTLSARLIDTEEPINSQELLVAVIGCNLAWGIIDGFLYLLGCVYERRQAASSPSEKVHLTLDELRGAAMACFLVFATAFPAAAPFLMIDNSYLALRISNAILISLLFLMGFYWGRHVGSPRPWMTGMLVMSIGILLVLIAIPLGG
jgi:hypothetical protein